MLTQHQTDYIKALEAIAALAGAFVLGFIGQLIYIRLTEGKDAARQFIKDEF